MRHVIFPLAAAAMSISAGGPLMAAVPEAICQLTALSFSDQTFNKQADAQKECTRLTDLLGADASTCTIDFVENDQGRVFARAKLRVTNQANGTTLGQALQQLQNLILGANLLADTKLGLQVTSKGACQ